MVMDCLAGMIASQNIPQYVFDVPKEQEDDVVTGLRIVTYSAPFESPVPATVVTRVGVEPAIDPTVSVTDVYPPYSAITKSLLAIVVSPVTLGLEFVPVQLLVLWIGNPDVGSNGVVVSAPETPKAMAEALVGVADNVTVITSALIVELVVPYHSTCVVS
jgi:hypothetical protein